MSSIIKNYFLKSKYFSIKHEKYFDVYEKIFSCYKNKKITFVEIGVENGGSLYIWKKLFPKAKIIGIDLNKNCKIFKKDGFVIEIGNQESPNFWKKFFKKHGKVDVILDDGGHTNSQQIQTIISCAPNIKDGGMIVTEDVMCSYDNDFGNPSRYSFINFCKKLIDDVNYKFPSIGKFSYSLNDYIHSIEFFESIVVFKINKKLCYFNNRITNKRKKFDHKDMRYNFKTNLPIHAFKKNIITKLIYDFSKKQFIKAYNIFKSLKYRKYFK